MREERKKEFPSSLSFRSYVLTACSRRTRRAAPLFVLSFVKLDERSRLGVPPSFLFFFLPACRCRRSIERLKRWCSSLSSSSPNARDDKGKSVETWRRTYERGSSVKSGGFAVSDSKLFSALNCAEKEQGEHRVFVVSIYNCKFYVIFEKISMAKIFYNIFNKCCFKKLLSF